MQWIDRDIRISHKDLMNSLSLIFALAYSAVLSYLPSAAFRDRENYFAYARNYEEIFLRYDSFLGKAFNEPLFLAFNYLGRIFFAPEQMPSVFVFIISFSVSYFVFKSSRNGVMLFFSFVILLLLPQVFHLQLVTLRQGLAVSMVIWAVLITRKEYFIALVILAAGFVHSSFFIFFVMYILDVALSGQNYSNRYYLRLFAQIMLSLVISISFIYLAQLLGARQATAQHLTSGVNVGGGALVLWSFVFFILLTRSRYYFYQDQTVRLAFIGILSYLTMYFISPLAGRFIISFLPFIIAAIVAKFSYRDVVLVFVIILAGSFSFVDTVKNNSLTPYGVSYFGF
ncbi:MULTISPECIES: EpsG family protein [Alkalimonas]|uniref:EpsG family protein n=1 Tax=Alkalimonas mucilaginosa TaxID=3057676 RepID=A0ABU7JBK9_9GAMM|nr:EpsG family protein [Alkalimonas sp. MEB004]MEE2023034.1 EpsG family protein [Alkalimonas sp. MEB004]